ncbi:MAG: ATP-binding protein [Pseudomonadota bacterium]
MNKPKIAIISEDGQNLHSYLDGKKYRIKQCENTVFILQTEKVDLPDVILLDGRGKPLPESLEICLDIRACKSIRYIVLIAIVEKIADGLQLIQKGLDDFIIQPVNPQELQVRIACGLWWREARKPKTDRWSEYDQLANMIRRKEDEIHAVMDAAADPIIVYNMEGGIDYVNPAFSRVFGWGKEELLGKRIDFVPEDQQQATGDQVRKVLQGKSCAGFETRRYTKERKLLDVLVSANLYRHDGEACGMVVTFHDVTEQKKNMEALKQAQALLMQSEKMASIGQLAAGVAHEINNPIGFVSSNTKTMGEYAEDLKTVICRYRALCDVLGQDGGRQAERISEIQALEKKLDIDYLMEDMTNLLSECREGLDRVKKIVMDLKDFSHPGEENKVACDINAGIESTVNVIWNEIKYKAEVIKNYGDLPYIDAYPQQLNQVFMNLLVNAAQAIPARGEIRITTRALDKEIEVEIADTGSGIPAENISKIFDPFFTTKEIGKGTGLGLNIAYQIIENHNGRIQVDSKIGEGTVFRIYLPIQD